MSTNNSESIATQSGGWLSFKAAVVLAVLTVLVHALAVVWALGTGGRSLVAGLLDILVPAAVALLMAQASWRLRGEAHRPALAWGMLAGAYLAYAIAELLGELSGRAITLAPPSLVGFGLYLLFYPLFLTGALRLFSAPLTKRERAPLLLDMGIVVLSVGLITWTLLVRPALGGGPLQPLRVLMTVAYPAGDLAVLWALLGLVLVRKEKSQGTIYSLLAASAACMILTDVAYSYYLLRPPSALYTLLDPGWTVGHVLAGLAAVRGASTVGSTVVVSPLPESRKQSRASLYLAYACLLAALAVLVGAQIGALGAVSAVAAIATVALVVVRQWMWLAENDRLAGELRVAHDTLERRVEERTAELARANQELTAEIAVRKRGEQRIELQLERLGALHAIDVAISSSLDLRLTLDVFLDKVVSQLRVDAAETLLLDAVSHTLQSSARRGLRGDTGRPSTVALGDGPAGQAALERRLASCCDLASDTYAPPRGEQLAEDGFHACWAVPLMAKGQVRGVLEVFAREVFEPDGEWLEFLGTLAGQGALAVENMSLFERTQRSNAELVRAYESTLEGWSRALELRDRETQGHTLRVTDTAVRLAVAAGINGDELVNLRRGALLHDIGKMAIPDSVLLKPGPLTEEEWRVMRLHPVHAYRMLSHVAYLRPALDIPYCHHEHWDGSGYPRGLHGEEIPLAARIFSVVDTWDALRHDRPYRAAWSAEQVTDHLRESSGGLFDPHIVELFLRL